MAMTSLADYYNECYAVHSEEGWTSGNITGVLALVSSARFATTLRWPSVTWTVPDAG